MWVRSLGWEDPLEDDMATHSSILAWRILRTEEPGGLLSMRSHSQTTLKRLSSSSVYTSIPISQFYPPPTLATLSFLYL